MMVVLMVGCAGPAPVYFHARSCTRMAPQEVTHILQDPQAVPDSDDEEDQAQWKVQPSGNSAHVSYNYVVGCPGDLT